MVVAKVDRDIAYVAMVVHVCCKLLFPMFHLFFQSTLQVCLLVCCICFTHMLQVFYLDVAYVFQWFQVFSGVFASVSDTCFKCFICLQTYVANVLSGCFKSRSSVAMAPVGGGQRPTAPTSRGAPCRVLSSPSPPFHSLHLVKAVRAQPGRRV